MIRGWHREAGARVYAPRKRKTRRIAQPPRPQPDKAPKPVLIILARAPRVAAGGRALRAPFMRALRLAKDARWRTVLCNAAKHDAAVKLAHALKAHGPAAVIGADRALTRAHVAAAFKALRTHSYALGPARDGGWWIIAARRGRDAERALRGLRWGQNLDDIMGRLPSVPAELATLR